MALTPINLAPAITDDIGTFYVTESGGLGLAQIAKNKVATADGAANGDLFTVAGGVITRLAIGADGEVLMVLGGALAYSPGFAFRRIGASTVTTPVSSIVFNNIPSSGYGEYLLLLSDFATALVGSTDGLFVQVSTDNGSTWKTTSGDYVTQGGTNRSSLTGGGIVCPGSTSASPGQAASCQIIGLGVANRVTALSYMGTRNVTGSVALDIPTTALSCYRNAREQDNAIRILSAGAANLTAGKATLYGIVE